MARFAKPTRLPTSCKRALNVQAVCVIPYTLGYTLGAISIILALLRDYDPTRSMSGVDALVDEVLQRRYMLGYPYPYDHSVHPSALFTLFMLMVLPIFVLGLQRRGVMLVLRARYRAADHATVARLVRFYRIGLARRPRPTLRLGIIALLAGALSAPLGLAFDWCEYAFRDYMYWHHQSPSMWGPAFLPEPLLGYLTTGDLLVLVLIWLVFGWLTMVRPVSRHLNSSRYLRRDLCLVCGYQLRGMRHCSLGRSDMVVCPECGSDNPWPSPCRRGDI